MNDEQINKTIAEYVGHKNISMRTIGEDIGMPMSFLFSGEPNKGGYAIPDYCNDLNAMHEAEKMLTAEQARSYDKELQKIGYRKRLAGAFWLWHFSAAWKAEAFLKTIDKWKE